jgi:hypothetical protein
MHAELCSVGERVFRGEVALGRGALRPQFWTGALFWHVSGDLGRAAEFNRPNTTVWTPDPTWAWQVMLGVGWHHWLARFGGLSSLLLPHTCDGLAANRVGPGLDFIISNHLKEKNVPFAQVEQLRASPGTDLKEHSREIGSTSAASVDDVQ